MSLTSHRSRSTKLACGALVLCASLAHAGDLITGGPYVPTPPAVVEAMLKLARVGPRDFVVDLGSGDGRVVLAAAARYRARGMGVDIDAELVEKSNAAAQRMGVADRVQFLRQDVRDADFRRATVLTMYLLPEMMARLRPKLLKELRPGVRIEGTRLRFSVPGRSGARPEVFVGTVEGDRIRGELRGDGGTVLAGWSAARMP